MNPLYQLLNQANTLVVNRLLAHALGTNEAIIYACLISKYYYYADRNMLNDGWFYSTAPDLQESSTLSEKQQKRAVDNLVKAGLLKCELRGMPAKRSFFIIENAELIGYYIAKGEEIATKIKPKAAETYERKRQTGEDTPNDTAVLPCSDKTAEQETTKGQTLLRQKVGASSDETAEHTFNHNINNHHIRNPYQSISPAAENIPKKTKPKKAYTYQNDESINYLSEQLATIRDFGISGHNDIYAKAEVIKKSVEDRKEEIKALSDELPTLKSDIAQIRFYFSVLQNRRRLDTMEQVKFAAAKEIAEKHGVKSASDIASLEKRLKLLPTYIASKKNTVADEQLRLKRITDLIEAYEKIVDGNYIDNLIKAQKEATLTPAKL